MNLGLTDKVMMVGGASKGLGYAVARALAGEGASVSLAARDSAALDKAAEMMGAPRTTLVQAHRAFIAKTPCAGDLLE